MRISLIVGLAIIALVAVVSCGVNVDLSAGPSADGKLALAQAGATATVQAAQSIAAANQQALADQDKVNAGTREVRTAQGNILSGAVAGGLGLVLLAGIPLAAFLGALYFSFVIRRKARQPSTARSGPYTFAVLPDVPGGIVVHDDQPGLVTHVGPDVPGKVLAGDSSVLIGASRSRAAIGAGQPGRLRRIQDALAAMRAFDGDQKSLPAPNREESRE